ncbi:glycosyltransferase [Helicobacter sp. 13S00477-4]|uniref:glycosyltransferase n=1 Tax=Helicobacter sp. 13S00477-4 TaxID=1905759 RepID=UPI000BA68B12|nr:glycosyltransferase [Helicobacter sp. 13S00477-4]PAF52162.1 hypothetical protein BKH44_03405 [Helicobacter sp. 13S00477-4]
MKIKIFCEAGKSQGLGHLIRCYRLKKLLLEISPDVTLYQRGDEISPLADHHCEWLENNKLKSLLAQTDVVIIDSYQATKKTYQKTIKLTEKLIVLDDSAMMTYPKNTIVLNGALGAEKLYDTNENYLLGIEYAIIDKKFFSTKIPKKQITDLLLTLGGTDPLGMTKKILEIIKELPFNLHIISRINFKKHPFKNKIKFYNNISSSQMAVLMKKCDVAISAGGGTLNELAMSQVPTLIIPIATNQNFQAKQWEEKGAMRITDLESLYKDLETIKSLKIRQEMILKYSNIPFGKSLFKKLKTIIPKCECI